MRSTRAWRRTSPALAAEQVIQCKGDAAIGHVDHIDAGHDFEQLADQMVAAANTGRAKTNSAGIGLGVSDELGNRLGRNRWMYHYDVGLPVNAGDRRDVADEIETKLVIERGVDGIPTADHEQRVAVRRCSHDRLCADVAAGTWSVFDNELLAPPF